MIHQRGYVKELIRKYAEGYITGVEFERLKACWYLYDEDKLLDMTLEVLQAMEAEKPDDTLKGWEPDFAEIIRSAERTRRSAVMVLHYTKKAE